MKITKSLICATFVNGAAASFAFAQDSTASNSQSEIDVNAGVSLTLDHTDNVFLTGNDRRGDWVTVLVPWVDVTVASQDYELSFGAEAEIARFNQYSSEDYEDFALWADGRYRLSDTLFAFGGITYAREHEDRNSPDDLNGLAPTELRDISGYFGIGGSWRENSYRLGLNITDLDFDDTSGPGGAVINNDDRDRRQYEFGGRLGVTQLAQGEIFVQGILNQRDYDLTLDDAGRGRSSKGFEANIGYSGVVGNLNGEITFGVLSQNYDDAGFGTVTVPDIGAELVWQPSRSTRVTAIIDRTIEESTITGASGYVSTAAGLRLRYRAAQDLSLAGYFFVTENDYNGIDRNDTIAEAGAELRYFINPQLYVDTGYRFQQRLSDVAGAEYSEHLIYLSFGTELQPNYEPGPVPRTRFDQGEFYVGSQLGYGILQSTVSGPRGGGGSLTADFGDPGTVGGFFGGYRTSVGSMVLGAEVDIEFGNQSWTHLGGRTFSVETGNTIGASAIIGHMTPTRNLIYGRFGVFGTEFESRYERAGNVASIDETKTGFSFGVGTEVELGRGLSARMEYQIRNFSDYSLGAPLGGGDDDNFANLQSVVRFGLVYTLGARNETLPDVEPVNFGGAYAGAMLGHATLQSQNTGPRPNAAAPSFILDVIRSGQGFTGTGFAGYGWQHGNLYWGVEAEAELSSASWNIERDPSGRIYSVDKTGAVNAMLRVGRVLNDNVLIYGRAGVSVGRFNTDYNFGGTTVDQNDTLTGLRVGVGVQYTIRDDLHLRMDYSHTNYGSHSVDYGAGVDNFDTSEGLFQVGLSYKF